MPVNSTGWHVPMILTVLSTLAHRKHRNSRDNGNRARNRRNRQLVSLLARRLNWANIENFFLRGVRESTPRDTHNTEYNQDRSKNFAHAFLRSI